MSPQPQPFTLHVTDDAIADLRMRLERTRFPDQAPGEPWAYGTDVGYMRELVDYWRDRYDWQAQEALLNGRYGRIRDVVPGPDGYLYFCTNNRDGRGSPEATDDRILRIAPSS